MSKWGYAGVCGGYVEWQRWGVGGGTARESGPHATIFGFCQKQQNPLS